MTSFESFSDLHLKRCSIVGVSIRHRHVAWVSLPFKELRNTKISFDYRDKVMGNVIFKSKLFFEDITLKNAVK